MNFRKIAQRSFLTVALGSMLAIASLARSANAAPRYDTNRDFRSDRQDFRQDLRQRRVMNRDIRRDFRQRYAMNHDIRQDRRDLWRDRRGR